LFALILLLEKENTQPGKPADLCVGAVGVNVRDFEHSYMSRDNQAFIQQI
jgi:hypothetical protein